MVTTCIYVYIVVCNRYDYKLRVYSVCTYYIHNILLHECFSYVCCVLCYITSLFYSLDFMMILRIIIALLLIAQYSWCIPVDQFYPFGASEGDQQIFSNFFSPGFPQSLFLSNGFSFYNRSIFSLSVSFYNTAS